MSVGHLDYELMQQGFFRPASTLPGFILIMIITMCEWLIYIMIPIMILVWTYYIIKELKKRYKAWKLKGKFNILPITSLPIKDRVFIEMTYYLSKQRCKFCNKQINPDVFRCSITHGSREVFFCTPDCRENFKKRQEIRKI